MTSSVERQSSLDILRTIAGAALDQEIGAASAMAAAAEPEFREAAGAKVRRFGLGVAYALRPKRLNILPAVIGLTGEFLLSPRRAAQRLEHPRFRGDQGFVGVSDDLSADAVLHAYRRGMYPFTHFGPVKWWSPEARAVLHPRETRIEKNLRRLMRQGKYRVTFDTSFAAVMRACAEPREGKTPLTWITPKIMKAYWNLHKAGYAHSVEVWDGDGKLVGGLYGLASGRVFFGESQFSFVRDASKIAVATLHCHLAHWGFELRDAKGQTDHLSSLGFSVMPRGEFLSLLKEHAWEPGKVGRWAVDETLDVAGWQNRR